MGEIVIKINKETGEHDIDMVNVAPEIVAQAFGMILRKMSEDKYVNVAESEDDFKIRNMMVLLTEAKINPRKYFQKKWFNILRFIPEDDGPFLCMNMKTGHVFPNMYFDREAKMFGDKLGRGYSDLTHWTYMPELMDNDIGGIRNDNSSVAPGKGTV